VAPVIALIALIAAVVVLGGGIEFLRRARFGTGASAAHHRALDTLGHITTQSADANSDLVEAAEPEVLSHVRKAVEGDRAQPRIEPQPVSRPVAVPAITGGPNFVGTIPAGQMPGRGPETEIEGVRLLLPEPDPEEVANGNGGHPDDGGDGDDLPAGAEGDEQEPTGQLALPIADDWDDDEWRTDEAGGWPADEAERADDAPAGADPTVAAPTDAGPGLRTAPADPEVVEDPVDEGWSAEAQRWASDEQAEDDWAGYEDGSPAEAGWEPVWEPAPPVWQPTAQAWEPAAQAWPPADQVHPGPPAEPAAGAWEPAAAGWEPSAPGGEVATPASPGADPAWGGEQERSERPPVPPVETAATTELPEGPGAGPEPAAADLGEAPQRGVTGWESVLHAGVGSPGGPVWDDHPGDEPAGWYEDDSAYGDDESEWAHDDQAVAPVPRSRDAVDGRPAEALAAVHDPTAAPGGATGDRLVPIDDLGEGDGLDERAREPGEAAGSPHAGPPTQPVARVEPDEEVPAHEPSGRVIRIDDLGESGWVAERTPYADEVAGGRWTPGESEPPARRRGPVGDETVVAGPRPDATGEIEPAPEGMAGREETEDGQDADGQTDGDERPVAIRFDDLGAPVGVGRDDVPELRPQHISAGVGRQAGAIPGLTPDETRAQLAALAQSGGMGAVPGTARRRHRRRSGDGRHRVASALMLIAAVVIFGGAVWLVTASSSGSHPHRAPAAAQTPAGTAPAPSTTTAAAASLVSQSSTTATYQVSGSPTITITFNSACWTQVRQGSPSGTLLFEGTESAGATKQLTGPVWVRLGNPTAVSISVGGTTVAQPTVTAGTPYNLQFQ
jgi:hypothetical protein